MLQIPVEIRSRLSCYIIVTLFMIWCHCDQDNSIKLSFKLIKYLDHLALLF